MSAGPQNGFGVYVHWPFCARICPYCDFNVYRDRGVDAARWSAMLVRDLEYWAERTAGRKLQSLYFGGGTPSLAPLATIEAVIEACERFWGFESGPEITLEANPSSAELDRFASFSAAGINRLSLGVQSFDDSALKFLGRDHDGAQAERALDRALDVFRRVTADFIYARPGQTVDQWRAELSRAMATGLKHLSLYQLTIEPGTAFDRAVSKKRWAPADEDLSADLFEATQAMAAAAGLPAYEVSNHAAAGEQSRHNMIYWRQGDYVGIGPGAHGRVRIDGARRATEAEKAPAAYLALVAASGCGAAANDPLTDEEILIERLSMGLRTLEGVALSDAEWDRLRGRIAPLIAQGLMIRREDSLIATADGRRLLNAVLVDLLA